MPCERKRLKGLVQYRSSTTEELVDFLSDVFIHPDQWRPLAFETFAGKFRGGVDAEFAPGGELARRVIQHIGGAAGEEAVAPRIGLGAGAHANSIFNFRPKASAARSK